MKKLIALFGATAIVFTCFTGCGNNKEKTADELKVMADSLYTAGNSALLKVTEKEEKEVEDKRTQYANRSFWISSDKNCYYDDWEFKDDLIKGISKEWKDSENVEWLIFFDDGKVTETYTANNSDSEIIGSSGATDTEGKNLYSIKNEYNLERDANGIYKAVNSALVELDENGIDVGGAFWFDSNKNISDTAKSAMIDSKDDFYDKISNFYAKADSCKWLVVCENGMVDYAFASDDFDSTTVSVYPESYAENFKGLILNEIKQGINNIIIEEKERLEREKLEMEKEEKELLKQLAIDTLLDSRVYTIYDENFGNVFEWMFEDYSIIATESDYQDCYEICCSGDYYYAPEFIGYQTNHGSITFLVNIKTGEYEVYDDPNSIYGSMFAFLQRY